MDNDIMSFSGFGVRLMVSRIFLMGLKVLSAMLDALTLVQVLVFVFPLILKVLERMLNPTSWQAPFIVEPKVWGLDRIELRAPFPLC